LKLLPRCQSTRWRFLNASSTLMTISLAKSGPLFLDKI
jgi:hypothetical protein